jgi:predicted ribosomally synthesized peptide with nif11-like leader
MSKENAAKFFSMIKENNELFDKVTNVKNEEDFLKLAAEAGFDLTAADFKDLQGEGNGKLSDEELQNISGGWGPDINTCPRCGSHRIGQYVPFHLVCLDCNYPFG